MLKSKKNLNTFQLKMVDKVVISLDQSIYVNVC